MAGKAIDLNKSVYDLCNEHKELPQLLHDLDFGHNQAGYAAYGGKVWLKEGRA